MLKRIISLGMAVVIAFTLFCLPVSAAEDETRYLYTYDCNSKLKVTSLNAKCESILNGYWGVTTKIEVTQTLQVKNGAQWRKCESWGATYYNYYCDFTNYRTVYSGNQYRVKSEFKVIGHH